MDLQPNEFLKIYFEPESGLVTYKVFGYAVTGTKPLNFMKYQVRYSTHATALQSSIDKRVNMAAFLVFDLDHMEKQLIKLKREKFGTK